MKSAIIGLLFAQALMFFGCAEQNSTTPSTTIVEPVKPEPIPVPPDTPVVPEPKEYLDTDILGIWNVTMEATISNCSRTNVGDAMVEVWNIEKTNGQIKIRVTNNQRTNNNYTGLVESNTLVCDGGGISYLVNAKIILKMSITDENNMEGTRELLLDEPCRAVYKVTAKKQ